MVSVFAFSSGFSLYSGESAKKQVLEKFYSTLIKSDMAGFEKLLDNRVYYIIGQLGSVMERFLEKKDGKKLFVNLLFRSRPVKVAFSNIKFINLGKTCAISYNITVFYSQTRKYSGNELMILVNSSSGYKVSGFIRYLKRN
jgi:hypothetical protein